ncbi:MAG: hypothetical protein HYZ37_05805 [Candidatus Solibacter usitatus]|nr:hypothetical protein [Candidatus Solibacter usitatus]
MRLVFSSRVILTFASFVLFSGCSKPAKVAAAPEPEKKYSVPRSRAADDAGRFFAGIPGKPDGPFHELEQDAAWAAHSKEFAQMWERREKAYLPALRKFQQSAIAAEPFSKGPVFYPFGGPDILTARTFFPNNGTYVLVGLEPPGTVPDVSAARSADLTQYLPGVRQTLGTLLRQSFFITADMAKQVRGQISDGLLLPLLIQLSLMRCEILGHQSVSIEADGKVVPRLTRDANFKGSRNDGVAVDFQLPTGEIRHLYYFSVNLQDRSFKENTALQAYLKSLQPYTTFFKSASYLPHGWNFTAIRNEVLANSHAIVQDDSGVPYRFIDKKAWNVRLYGQYSPPYGIFKNMLQPDLLKAYEESSPTPLGFYIGYGYGRRPSTVMVMSKKS